MKLSESEPEQGFISLLEAQGHLSVSNQDYNSRPRNTILADTCFKSGYIDAWGRGTLKIIEACKEAGLPEPELLEKDGGVQVTLFKSEGGQVGGQIGGQVGGQMEKIRSEFGSLTSRAEADVEKNKGDLKSALGSFSAYFQTNFGVNSDEIRSKKIPKTSLDK